MALTNFSGDDAGIDGYRRRMPCSSPSLSLPVLASFAIAAAVFGSAQTSNAAELATAPGYDADLVVLDGDPTMNISAVRNVALVMKSGTIYDPNELDRAVGITPRRH